MRLWINNTEGRPDAALTFSLAGFIIVVIKLLLNGSTIAFADFDYEFGSIDADQIAAILAPTLGAYVGRRYTDKKFSSSTKVIVEERSHQG